MSASVLPPDHSLLPQQFYFDPGMTVGKIYVGVPASKAPTGKLLVLDLADITTKVPLAGGTMSGPLTLYGDPSLPLQAATKRYVDTSVAAYFATLPTSDTSLATGALWWNGGFLCRV